MNKLFTRIMASVAGFAMAIGVGVAFENNKIATPAYAAAEAHEHLFTSSTLPTGWTNSGMTFNSSYYKADAGNYVQLSSSSMFEDGKVLNGNVSVDIACGTFGTWSGAKTATFTVAFLNSSGAVLTSATGTTGQLNSTQTTYRFSSSAISLGAPDDVSAIASLRVAVTTLTSTSTGCLRFAKVKLTYEQISASSASVSSVSVTGAMSKTSYTTVESWSNNGLTADVTMDDGSDYPDSVDWSYNPETPAEAVKNNNNEEVTGLSVTATASAGEQQGSKSTTGISVAYATVAQGLAVIPNADDQVDGVIVRGTISHIDEINTSSYYNATYYISDSGNRDNELKIYRGKGLENANFTNSNDIKVGDVVVVYGNLKYYNGTSKQFLQGNYLLKLDRPASSDPSITIVQSNFTINVGDDDVTLTENHENIPDGGSIKWESSDNAIATVGETTGVVHAVSAGSVTIKAKIVNNSDEEVISDSITVTVTNINYPVSDGDSFIIKYSNNTTTYYFSGINNNIGLYSETKSDALVFSAEEGETAGQFYLGFNGESYLSYTGSDNKIYSSSTKSNNTLWTIVSDGISTSIENVAVSNRIISFNTRSGQERFCCYTSASNVDVELVEAPAVDTVTVAGDAVADAGNATSIVKEFSYEVTYVNPLNPGSQAVNVTVLNSSDGTDGASVTTAPSNGSFEVTFTASDTYTVTVTSVEDSSKSDSTTIIVSNIYVPVSAAYKLYTGTTLSSEKELTKGDYIICYEDNALNPTITSDRAQFTGISATNNTVTTNDSSIIWRVTKAGDYYTLYNLSSCSYLASTGTKSQIQTISDGSDDHALWSVSIVDNTFKFVNKYNSENDVNATLRKNGSYGFACYAPATGDAMTLYKRDLNSYSYLETATSVETLYAKETAGGGQIEEGSVAMRFGITMPKASWDAINECYPITDYGVMCLKRATLNSYEGSNTIEQAFRNPDQAVTNFNRGNGDTPYEDGDNYRFYVRIGNISEANYDTSIVVAPYILADGQYYFFTEMEESVRSLATKYYNDNTLQIALSNAALRNLAGISE